MKYLKILILLSAFMGIRIQCMDQDVLDLSDEIEFFNVGQGHAVLIKKAGVSTDTNSPYVPLLIDAGATAHPYVPDQKYEWNKGDSKLPISKTLSISKITRQILEFWQSSNNASLLKGKFKLNIIITHPDADHLNFVPEILNELIKKAGASRYSFCTSILLGGIESMYSNMLLPDSIKNIFARKLIYSKHKYGIFFKDQCDFLDESGCITHLFCPKGIKSDDNRWSIITRIQINGISAILTGDADCKVKAQMLNCLGRKKNELESDILLVPHHGAEDTYQDEWDNIVNPRALIIGSAPNQKYCHPRGETILKLLSSHNYNGRLWNEKVRPHGIQYCTLAKHGNIQEVVQNKKKRMFDAVPNVAVGEEGDQLSQQWQLAWVDLPIYTLWTTGTLFFKGNVERPGFVEAPNGLMNYVAVPQPGYLFSPHVRNKLNPLADEEQQLCQHIFNIMKINHGLHGDKLLSNENNLMTETMLIHDLNDRALFLMLVHKVLNEKAMAYSQSFFRCMSEAVSVSNNPLKEDRLTKAVDIFIKGDLYGLKSKKYSLDDIAYILKTFSRSYHKIEHLGKYIMEYPRLSGLNIDDLCPFGFPEWAQLNSLLSFYEDIPNDSDYTMPITDMIDIKFLRQNGMTFKEVAKKLLEVSADIETCEIEKNYTVLDDCYHIDYVLDFPDNIPSHVDAIFIRLLNNIIEYYFNTDRELFEGSIEQEDGLSKEIFKEIIDTLTQTYWFLRQVFPPDVSKKVILYDSQSNIKRILNTFKFQIMRKFKDYGYLKDDEFFSSNFFEILDGCYNLKSKERKKLFSQKIESDLLDTLNFHFPKNLDSFLS